MTLVSLNAQTITDTSDPQPDDLLLRSESLVSSPPKVIVSAFSNPEVQIIAPTSTDFQSLMNASAHPSVLGSLQPLLPYSVILRNNSTKSIIAYTVSWSSIDKSGRPNIDYRTVCDAIQLKGLISPSSDSFVTIVGTPPSMGVAEVAEEEKRFQSQGSITISLEAVMFEDGTTSGSDRSLSILQIKARIQSENDLFKSVLTRDSASVKPWLEALSAAVRPGSRLNLSTDPYPVWYQFYQARIASTLLKRAAAKSIPELIDSVRSEFYSKHYPDFSAR
jgi:hypothetical protein